MVFISFVERKQKRNKYKLKKEEANGFIQMLMVILLLTKRTEDSEEHSCFRLNATIFNTWDIRLVYLHAEPITT